VTRRAIVLATTLAVGGCASGPFVGPVPAGSPAAVGRGRYHYRLTLVDAEGNIEPKTPFALSLPHRVLPFVAEQKNVWRGITDARGRTPVFALPFRLRERDVFLRGRIGDGPNGEQFWIGSDAKHPAVDQPYRLVVCTTPPTQYIGHTDARGYTVYAASVTPVRLHLYEADEDLVARAKAGLSAADRVDFARKNAKTCKEDGTDGD